MIIPVSLADRSYTVHIDEPASFTETLSAQFPSATFVLVTNRTLETLYASTFTVWEKKLPLGRFSIDDGEQYKTIDTWRSILDFLLGSRLDRNTVIIAFGGGVVGDIAGFAASAFLRGVACVQVPTTLLAMVDSSVGGKTGVNHPMGKNLIGAFHQPKLVWIETGMLASLPDREFNAGYAEVFKYAFIGSKEMFDFISKHHTAIVSREKELLTEAITRSIAIKARIVMEDEHESGNRALLNFGHTFGHALEKFYDYQGIMHGEGVWWGITCAIDLGKRIGTIHKKHADDYDALIEKIALPPLPLKPDVSALYTSMFSDKKVRSGKLRFVLPKEPGSSILTSDVAESAVKETLTNVFS
jgi:3-dehydroquinate synthase